MNVNKQKIACESIERINHIWFDENAIEEPFEKITALFQLLVVLAPYSYCWHAGWLWQAYLSAKSENCWRLARYRLRLFEASILNLKETIRPLSAVRA